MKHLADRFFRASNVSNIQGTGLGLNIVRVPRNYWTAPSISPVFTERKYLTLTFTIVDQAMN